MTRVCLIIWSLIGFTILMLYLLSTFGAIHVVVDGHEHTFSLGVRR